MSEPAALNLQERFAAVGRDNEEHQAVWKSLWDDGTYLPWDRGFASPSLVDFLTDHPDIVKSSTDSNPLRALVPGCGRGYDVLLFASLGLEAYGLELSSSAVKVAVKNAEAAPPPPPPGSRTFITGDFFETASWSNNTGSESPQFDIIYDYTFLCALDPAQGLREKWAARMAELVKKGGVLICLEFPLYKDFDLPGPPWPLRSEIYQKLLEGVGFEREIHEKPRRYHEAGMGSDMISLWRRR
ncbi:hypothetical protein ABW19_dt0208330 [Dactylella cylindrospora]|nr:hypothetical protein ABW19_dt0208330 [Dactylella cylindrospora]